ncbi:hypothetical protein B5S28_g4110 [[Candida] boidinii]|nr:hypothetical protein B5S28_g4110 [[Candida] boidinii]OWB59576.1 hypothetical protein B5S29_g435 [[Candida] boidinii]OWB74699.1 hypothetical protein B5S31_g4513 [[Candida] boidinii]OWB79083.1 hypothetical protein B5S32_g3294 [[Candida] boidinii]
MSSISDIFNNISNNTDLFQITLPSFNNPFGLKLWPIFNYLSLKLTNNYFQPENFEFIEGETFFSTPLPVLSSILIYYIVIFGGRYLINSLNIKPLILNGLFQIHNLILTSISLILVLLYAEQIIPTIYNYGLYFSICDEKFWTNKMVCLYYLTYITKFIEFIDTLFLVVKQKKLTFLHTYHHGATALLCYTQLIGNTTISWVPITLNLGVHVVMYWYYFLSSRGIRVWWKEWVTRFQIIQFILDLIFIYFATYQKIVHNFFPDLPHCGDCAGTTLATIAGCTIISSYLFLFIAFYIEVYRKSSTKKSKVVKRVRGGVAAKVNEYVLLDSKTLSSGFDSNTGSPLPPKNRSRKI